MGVWWISILVTSGNQSIRCGLPIRMAASYCRGRDDHAERPLGGRGRLPAPRLPQNVACRFPALRSSEGASQHGDSLQLRVREIQLWSHQWKPLLDLLELLPQDLPFPTPTAEHDAPATFHDPMDPLQCADVPGNAVVRIMAAEHLIEDVRLFPDRQMPQPPQS